MKKIFLCGFLLCLGIIGLVACGGSANNANANANANTNRTYTNAPANNGSTVGNAVNTVANAVSSATTSKPEDFMSEAAQGGMAEVEMGKLASTKAKDPEVKKYGQMMVDDHTKANTELKTLAATKKITLPADIGSSNKSTLDKLKGLSGADFDKEYVKDMVSDHETDVKAFEKQADNSTDPEVKAFAAKTLPVLKKHLDAIKAIQSKMK